ncbi:MAG: hypothetical protein ACYDB3_09650, partial [Acidimicrobiales bacterium]
MMLPWRVVPLMGIALAIALPALPALPGTTSLAAANAVLQVGAAQVDITPPVLGTPAANALDQAEFVPLCGTSESQIAQLWPGK